MANEDGGAAPPPDKPAHASDDDKRAFYASARTELIQRLVLRDQALIAYIVAAGSYIGLVVQPQLAAKSPGLSMAAATLAVLPILSLVFALIMVQHQALIGRLAQYLRELYPEQYFHWDHFYAKDPKKFHLKARTFAQALVLVVPMGYTLAFILVRWPDISAVAADRSNFVLLSIVDLIVAIFILKLHIDAHKQRALVEYPDEMSPKG